MSARAWIDGLPGESVPFDDRGLMYGDGLFETIVCRDGAPCFLGQHLARLAAGCAALGIAAPEAALLAAELRHAATLGADGVVRVVVTRGSSPERGYAPPAAARPRRIVARYPLPAAVDAGAGIRRMGRRTISLEQVFLGVGAGADPTADPRRGSLPPPPASAQVGGPR